MHIRHPNAQPGAFGSCGKGHGEYGCAHMLGDTPGWREDHLYLSVDERCVSGALTFPHCHVCCRKKTANSKKMLKKGGIAWGSWVGGSASVPIGILACFVAVGLWLLQRYPNSQWLRYSVIALSAGVALLVLVAMFTGPIRN